MSIDELILDARAEIPDLVENVGSLCLSLREAYACHVGQHRQTSIEDALDAADEIVKGAEELRVSIARLVEAGKEAHQ